ncbi:MAG: 3-phosphoshikimate 1-carboxyvinyltransferase [Candidatus Nanopelagicales bacterium]|nr:3-phosphoshikimate 1-carboxyvinyltransferase [Candidatus Nanopelagicales bacterium]
MQTWAAPHARTAFEATVEVPGSKSMTNRALVLAALAVGRSTLSGWLDARDTALMIDGLRALGADITRQADLLVIHGRPLRAPADIDCGLAGTVMRFLPPVAAMAPGDVRFTGDPQAAVRPLTPMLGALRDLGADITGDRLPFTVHGAGFLRGGVVSLDASASSQFISGLLLSAPAMRAGLQMRHVGPPLPSAPHIEMTLEMLGRTGVTVTAKADQWSVDPGPIAAHDWVIEPDLSNAGPFLAAAVVTGSQVTIPRWPARTTQAGDYWRDFLEDLGAEVSLDDDGLHVRGSGGYDGFDVDLRAVGELAPTIAALAALADSPSEITGIGHLRGHETDRLQAIATELRKLGVGVAVQRDGLAIDPGSRVDSTEITLDTYADHRMATMAAILALRIEGLRVADPATTAKTMPDFVQRWEAMLA